MTDYWTSTKSPRRMYRPPYHTPERDEIIRETAGVDPAMLVDDLKMTTPQIRAYQRALGVRKITSNKDYRSKKRKKG